MSAPLREGYKQTEVGVIPEDWEVLSLCDLAEIRGGIAKNSNIHIADPISIHYLRVANVQDGYLDLSEMSKIELSRRDLTRYTVLPGDVLMNEGGDLDKLGRGAIWRGEFNPCVNQNHVFVVRCKQNLLPDYLNLWTATKPARRFFLFAGKQTTNLASISKSSLGELPVSTPPIPEQRAIAEALSDTNALIESLEQLIIKKRLIKQGSMQDLLTGKKRLPGFSGKWETKLLATLAHIKTGSKNNEDKIENGAYPFFVRSQHVERINTFSHKCEAILIPGEGNIGNIFHYINGSFDVHQRVYTITQFSDKAFGKYIYYYMVRNFGLHAMQNSVKATVDSLRLPTFKNFEIAVPPTRTEQIAITTVLSDMEMEIAELKMQLTKANTIKQGMMNELLTGKIRLI